MEMNEAEVDHVVSVDASHHTFVPFGEVVRGDVAYRFPLVTEEFGYASEFTTELAVLPFISPKSDKPAIELGSTRLFHREADGYFDPDGYTIEAVIVGSMKAAWRKGVPTKFGKVAVPDSYIDRRLVDLFTCTKHCSELANPTNVDKIGDITAEIVRSLNANCLVVRRPTNDVELDQPRDAIDAMVCAAYTSIASSAVEFLNVMAHAINKITNPPLRRNTGPKPAHSNPETQQAADSIVAALNRGSSLIRDTMPFSARIWANGYRPNTRNSYRQLETAAKSMLSLKTGATTAEHVGSD